MSDKELIAEIAEAHKAVSRMIIDGTLAGWTDSAHAAHRDRATLLRVLDEAARYATRLACTLCERHFPNPEWNPLPDLIGVLTQIDNMTAGLAIRLDEAAAREDRLRYFLRIYVHAHEHGNAVPPNIDGDARAALEPGVKSP